MPRRVILYIRAWWGKDEVDRPLLRAQEARVEAIPKAFGLTHEFEDRFIDFHMDPANPRAWHSRDRAVTQACLDGAMLVVDARDKLAGSQEEFEEIAARLGAAGARLEVVEDYLKLPSPFGKLLFDLHVEALRERLDKDQAEVEERNRKKAGFR